MRTAGKLATLLALLAGVMPERVTARQTTELPVMTFNIRYGTADDGEDRWSLRRGLLLDVIREHGPVVLGVQEALRFQLDEMREALGRYDEVGVGRDDGVTAGEYSAILFDTTRVALLDEGTFWFSDTPAVPGSMSWGNTIPRICTWARLRGRDDGGTFTVYNVHWDHLSQPSRERSAALLLERIAARANTDPVLVMGDFNAGETNPAFVALVHSERVPLRDTFRALHADATEVGTYHAFRGGLAGDRIDAILAGPAWEIVRAAIVRTERDGRYPSDHYPVIAVLRLE
ncbi:MAG: endonuclease/exonuclease/phosphatase family protein [Longimicrobiales bacterium]